MKTANLIAFDLGAGSGRTMIGRLRDDHLQIQEINRFPNRMVEVPGSLHWNIFQLFEYMKDGLRMAGQTESKLDAMAVDTWGVDFGLVDKTGEIMGLPHTYRDSRTDGIMDPFFRRVSQEQVYALTGIQVLQINTLYQLFAMRQNASPLLDAASDILLMPDLFNYLLTGQKVSEFTMATTTQLYNPRLKTWDPQLLEVLELSDSMLQKIVAPGTVISSVTPDIIKEAGLEDPIPVIACASHDTGSAVAAVPAEGDSWAYISSGTWSLMGIETSQANTSEQARDCNFTNEGGVDGTYRFLKNITGLWLVQQCKKSWEGEHAYTYEELTHLAEQADPFKCLIDPDFHGFLNPPNMPQAIREYCRFTDQVAPDSVAEIMRCVLESLALKYRLVLDQLLQVQGSGINRIHIIGGGSENTLLCQFTANATTLPVFAGPKEATAIGNILVQALALGLIDSLEDLRRIVRGSFTPRLFEPSSVADWEDAYRRFLQITEAKVG